MRAQAAAGPRMTVVQFFLMPRRHQAALAPAGQQRHPGSLPTFPECQTMYCPPAAACPVGKTIHEACPGCMPAKLIQDNFYC
jgi:hypothetical protein